MLPTTLLSGFAFPIDQMPPPIQAVTYLVHSRYYMTILKAIFLKGSGPRRPHRADRGARRSTRSSSGFSRPALFARRWGEAMCGRINSLVLKEFLQLRRDTCGALPPDRSSARSDDHLRLRGDLRGVQRLDRGARSRPQPGEPGAHLPLRRSAGASRSSRSPGRPTRSARRSTGRKPSVAIVIQAGFAEELRKGQSAPAQIIVDGTNSNTALIALGYVERDRRRLTLRTWRRTSRGGSTRASRLRRQ